MSLLVRLCLSLGVILAILAGVLWSSHRVTEASIDELREHRRVERALFLDRAVHLQGVGLENLTSSYSWWNEMVEFVRQPDTKWAADNIDNIVGVPNGADALWVLNAALTPVHQVDDTYNRPPPPFVGTEPLRRFIGERYQFHYFVELNGQLWQIFGAAIQDPQFWRNETAVEGYLLLGKRWDDTWIARLGALSGSQLSIASAGQMPSLSARQFIHELLGTDGQPAARILGTFETSKIDDASAALRREVLVFVLGLLALLVCGTSIIVWLVIRPIETIVRSLEARNPVPLGALMASRSRFGEIARLLASHYRQGRMLQDEIRRHLEAAKPWQHEREKESNEELRLQLASDLHDGPLQSIYAAGLKLAALESRLTSGRSVAPAELEAIRTILSECTTNLRNLLFNLEPEELRDQDLEIALERLERYMRSIAAEFRLQVNEHALEGLSRDSQVHLFYICRELVSNAARHARPSRATLIFRRREGFLEIEWSNDGINAPDRPTRTGNGLRNIDQRVKRLDGSWQYRVHRTKYWLVNIELPYTSLVGPISLEAPAS